MLKFLEVHQSSKYVEFINKIYNYYKLIFPSFFTLLLYHYLVTECNPFRATAAFVATSERAAREGEESQSRQKRL